MVFGGSNITGIGLSGLGAGLFPGSSGAPRSLDKSGSDVGLAWVESALALRAIHTALGQLIVRLHTDLVGRIPLLGLATDRTPVASACGSSRLAHRHLGPVEGFRSYWQFLLSGIVTGNSPDRSVYSLCELVTRVALGDADAGHGTGGDPLRFCFGQNANPLGRDLGS